MPFVIPPSHPFNPLPAPRLEIAAGSSREAVQTIFSHIYGKGGAPDNAQAIAAMAADLCITDVEARLDEAAVKDTLRNNTNEAIAAGLFGVPTFVIDGEVFWGDDATDMAIAFAHNPDRLRGEEMNRLSAMPMGIRRQPTQLNRCDERCARRSP